MSNDKIPIIFNNLFSKVNFGVVIHAESEEIVYHNRASETILGLEAEGISCKKSTDDSWIAYKEDGSFFKGEDHPAMISLKTGNIQENIIMKILNRSLNTFKWIKIDSYPIQDNGSKYILTTFSDITEKKESELKAIKNEKQFTALYLSMQEGVALHELIYNENMIAKDYVILDVNPSYLKILDLKKEDILNKSSKEAYRVDNSPYLNIYSKVVETGIASHFEVYFPPLNKYFEVSAVKYDEGHFATIFFDISDRKKGELTIKNQMDLLLAKNEEMEQLNYSVSHDLKSPLLTIKGFSQQLEKDLASKDFERIESSLERIKRASDKMQYLIEDLLKYSKAGRLFNQSVRINTELLVNELLYMFQLELQEKNAEIKVETYLPDIYADHNKIREIFQNLLENALKFSYNSATPKITIGYKDKYYYFSDNGIGISENHFDRIFQVFEKLEKNSYGSGIGLSIVKKIINFYNCKIWVESEGLNKGSVFYFNLPLYSLKDYIFPEDAKYPCFITTDSKDPL